MAHRVNLPQDYVNLFNLRHIRRDDGILQMGVHTFTGPQLPRLTAASVPDVITPPQMLDVFTGRSEQFAVDKRYPPAIIMRNRPETAGLTASTTSKNWEDHYDKNNWTFIYATPKKPTTRPGVGISTTSLFQRLQQALVGAFRRQEEVHSSCRLQMCLLFNQVQTECLITESGTTCS